MRVAGGRGRSGGEGGGREVHDSPYVQDVVTQVWRQYFLLNGCRGVAF